MEVLIIRWLQNIQGDPCIGPLSPALYCSLDRFQIWSRERRTVLAITCPSFKTFRSFPNNDLLRPPPIVFLSFCCFRFEVQGTLDAQKEEFARREEAFRRREDGLRQKDLELQGKSI